MKPTLLTPTLHPLPHLRPVTKRRQLRATAGSLTTTADTTTPTAVAAGASITLDTPSNPIRRILDWIQKLFF